jgi:hypothetical protein
MARIKARAPLVPRADGRTVSVAPKHVDPHYHSEQHRQWRERFLRNADYRCERIAAGNAALSRLPPTGCSPTMSRNGRTVAIRSIDPTASVSVVATIR